MMKILRLLLILLFVPFILSAQKTSPPDRAQLKKLVQSYMTEKKSEWKITDKDIADWSVSDLYTNKKFSMTYLYVQQEVNGIQIFNAISSVAIKDYKVLSFAKKLYPDAASKINTGKATLTPVAAIQKTAAHLELPMTDIPKLISTKKSLHKYIYSSKISDENITVNLVFVSVKNSLLLAWNVNIRLNDKSHWWNVRIDAVNGNVIEKNDWVRHCDFGAPVNSPTPSASQLSPPINPASQASAIPTYRVYALPLEAPSFGPSTLLTDPSDPVASPFGWHDTNGVTGADYTITRGNNVYAYDDIAGANAPGTSADGTSTLTFDFPANFTQPPASYLNASITNLFYLNNMMHDRLVHYGFDEASGNFQSNNYSGQGIGGDFVFAECQDGGGTNNANFATPPDGQNGTMQMYLWSGNVTSTLTVNSPPSVAGNYNSAPAGFGPNVVTPVTGDFVLVDDGNGTTSDACEPLVNGSSLPGKIAVIDRGTCNFVDKVLAAQNEGAIAVIMCNNTAGTFAMGDNGNGGSVTIPSVMISQSDGTLIKNAMAAGTVNGTLNPPPSGAVDLDGSLDNGIVMHEYGHGVSTRLTGGPTGGANCLFNAEEGGEGWSDYFALLFTMKPGDVGTAPRGMGTYALSQPINGLGIRRYPYSTDMNIDPETYGFVAQSTEVHDIGEVWCTALWEMTWAFVDSFGFNSDWINGTGGNNIALQLVIEGLKLQPCGPGFLDGRDAILLADDNLYGGIHKCIIWAAFAKRGMGFNAVQGSGDNANDQTENFDMPPVCLVPTAPPVANFGSDITTSCFGIIHFHDSSTSTPQAYLWDFGDGNTSIFQNPTHTYSSSGTYTVKLVVTNTLGIDSLIRTSYITIAKPQAPSFTGDTTLCGNNSTVLTALVQSGNIAEWRDVNDSALFTGTVFTTPLLTSSTTYNLVQYTPSPSQHVGPLTYNIGTSSVQTSQNFEGQLLFTTLAPVRLISFWVEAQGTALRTINLYSGGTLLNSTSIMIPDSASRITVNFDIPAPGNYQIGISPVANMWRNTNGSSYPYNIAGLLSITASNNPNNPTGAYYYFYDWEVQEMPCTSDPLPVNVIVDNLSSHFTYADNGLIVTFTNTSAGTPTTIHWDFGNGQTSSLANPGPITYAAPGNYTVSLTLTDAAGCQTTAAQIITVSQVGIDPITESGFDVYYLDGDLIVKFQSQPANARIRIYDSIGKLIVDDGFSNGMIYSKELKNISSEFILVNVEDGDKRFVKEFVVNR